MIIYSTKDCPNCINAKMLLDKAGQEYENKDLGKTKNLAEFLKIRDENPLYDEIKAKHKVGVPTFVLDDGTITIDFEKVKDFYNLEL